MEKKKGGGSMSEKRQGLVGEIGKRTQLLNLLVGTVVRIPLGFIVPFEGNPRKFFDEKDIEAQAEYIREKGDVIHPLEVVVRVEDDNPFAMIVDGERRFRSAKVAQISHLSCLIKPDKSDNEILRDSLVANLNRREMSPIEEALAFREMIQNEGLTQAQVARFAGKHQTQVSATLKMLTLHKDVQAILLCGMIDKGIARYLTSFPQEKQSSLLKLIEKEVEKRGRKLNVNEAWAVILGIAQAHGINPVKGNRGRKRCSIPEMVCRKVLRTGGKFREALNELAKTDDKQLVSQQGQHLLNIIGLLKELEKPMKRQEVRLDKLD